MSSEERIPLAVSYYVLYSAAGTAADAFATAGQLFPPTLSQATLPIHTTTTTDSTTTATIQTRPDTATDDDDDGNDFAPVQPPPQEPPWRADEWTVADQEAAAQLLTEAESRCRRRRVGHSTTTTSNHSNDENVSAWNRFYQQHQTNFFKDRHYLSVTFPNEFGPRPPLPHQQLSTAAASHSMFLASIPSSASNPPPPQQQEQQPNVDVDVRCLVEVGCGVGNTMLPLLEEETCIPSSNDTNQQADNNSDSDDKRRIQWTVYGLDLSSVAIDMLQTDVRFVTMARQGRAHAAVCDISVVDSVPHSVRKVATVTTLLFCLSAIPPDCHAVAMRNAASTLQPPPPPAGIGSGGGVLVFRDYGRYDAAQLQLGRQRDKLHGEHENFYRKHDGTQCYYFTVADVRNLAAEAGLDVLECRYICRVYENRRNHTQRRRVWVQARFRRKDLGETIATNDSTVMLT